MGIHKEVGDKAHKFQLDDKEYLKEEEGTADAVQLRKGVDKFIEKLDILSESVIKLNKFKKSTEARVLKMEEKQKDYLSVLECHEEMSRLEDQLSQHIKQRLEEFNVNQTKLEAT